MKLRLAIFVLTLGVLAAAQSLDLAGGIGAVKSGTSPDISGGYFSFSATGMVTPKLGVNADVALVGPRISFGGGGTRPLLFSLNFVVRDPLPNWAPEFQLGYALERVEGQCANCVTNTGLFIPPPNSHLSGVHFGLADTAYITRRIFARAEYHLYLGSGMAHPNRFTLSVGYTFGHRP